MGEEYTIQQSHVGGGAGVHNPLTGVLERELVEYSNQARLIPHLGLLRLLQQCKCSVGLRGWAKLAAIGARHLSAPNWASKHC